MKSLLLESFYTLKYSALILLGIILVYAFLFIPSQGAPTFVLTAVFMAAFSLLSRNFFMDYSCHWTEYVVSLPIKKNTYVLSKYVLFLLSILLSSIISLGIVFIFYSFGISVFQDSVQENLNTLILLTGFNYLIISGSLFIFLSFKFGFDKISVVLIFSILIPSLFLYLFYKLNPNLNIEILNRDLIIGIPISLVILFISYLLSIRTFNKKLP